MFKTDSNGPAGRPWQIGSISEGPMWRRRNMGWGLLLLWSLGCVPNLVDRADPAPQGVHTDHVERETWDVIFAGGTKVGAISTRIRPVEENGHTRHEITSHLKLVLQRFGESTEQNLVLTSLETPAGSLQHFECRIPTGGGETVTQGEVEKDQLNVVTTSSGRPQSQQFSWPAAGGGFSALDISLRSAPLKPGEHRVLYSIIPVPPSVVPVELQLTAADWELVPLLDTEKRLLRVELQTQLPDGNRLPSTLWIDEQGEILKQFETSMRWETFRTTRELAEAPIETQGYDLGSNLVVSIDRPWPAPHESRRVVYRVRLRDREPADVFPDSMGQSVEARGAHEAEVTVTALRPDHSSPSPNASPPTPADLAANSLVQTEDAKVLELAAGVSADNLEPWALAVALEQLVHARIEKKNYSAAFDSAADVARTLQGDCTEHAVLLTAVCRARKIPTRVAVGLVYYPAEQGFAYHMWNEVWIRDRWIPLDSTQGRGGISAAYLKLAQSSLSAEGMLSLLLPVLHVVDQLSIDVVNVDGEPLADSDAL